MEAYLDKNKLEDYLGNNNVVCREERQFALFLYLIFLEKKKGSSDQWIADFVKGCLDEKGEDLDIEEVYYEATLLRDYFALCKKEGSSEAETFNNRLLHFCLDFLPYDMGQTGCENRNVIYGEEKAVECIKKVAEHCGGHIDFHLGTKKMKAAIKKTYPNIKKDIENKKEDVRQVYEKACFDIAGMMMNATPDILVVYRIGKAHYVKALECKYKSDEGIYGDVAGVGIKMQYFIQECVMSFLFGKNKELFEENLPKKPAKGKFWREGDKTTALCDKLWKNVYEGILKQENRSEKIINKGVRAIKFFDEKDSEEDTKSDGEKSKRIGIRELMEHMYVKSSRG